MIRVLFFLIAFSQFAVVFPAAGEFPGDAGPADNGWKSYEFEDRDNMHMLAHWLGGVCKAVEMVGTTAYMGSGPSLEVVSFEDVANPVRLGQVLLPGVVEGVDISGGLACIAIGSGGMALVEISDPERPRIHSVYDSPGEAKAVIMDGMFAYLADGESGLRVINISSWVNPVEVAHVSTADAHSVDLSEGYAFLADGPAGLVVVDIGDPNSPYPVGGLDTPGNAYDVKLDGEMAFVADGSSGLRMIDISSPSSPFEVGSFKTERYAHQVDLFDFATGSFAAVADEKGGLYVITVTNPAVPTELRHFETMASALGVVYSDQKLFVAVERRGVQVFSLGVPFEPVETGRFNTGGETLDVAVSGNYAYLADGEGCFRVIQISNPTFPFEVDDLDFTGCNGQSIAWGNDKAYVNCGGELRSVNVSNPSYPYWELGCGVCSGQDLEFSGSYLYSAEGQIGLKIIDRADPTYWVGLINTPGTAYGVDVQANYPDLFAYVADGSGGLRVINVSDKRNPVEVASVETSGEALAVAVDGDYAYVVGLGFMIEAFNIADPLNPFRAGFRALPGQPFDVTVANGYAYVVVPNAGLYIFSLADPTNPIHVGAFETTARPRRVAVVGDQAYLACRDAGLLVIDIGPPGEVGHYQTGNIISDIAVDWPHIYVADGGYFPGSVLAVNFSQEENPTVDAFYESDITSDALDNHYSNIYLADGLGMRRIQYIEQDGFFEYATIELGYPWEYSFFSEVVVEGDWAFVYHSYTGLHQVDVGSPFMLYDYESTYCNGVWPGGLAIDGPYLYVADGDYGLRKIQTGVLVETGRFDSPGYARGVAVSGENILLADGPGGLRVIDSSWTSQIGHCDIPGEAYGVQVSGDFAYVAAGEAGVRMIHIADPTNPIEVGYFDTPGEVRSLQVQGVKVYAADYYYGVYVLFASIGVVGVPDPPVLVSGDVLSGEGQIRVVWELNQDVPVGAFRLKRRLLSDPEFGEIPGPKILQEKSRYTFIDEDFTAGERYEYRVDLFWEGEFLPLFTEGMPPEPVFELVLFPNQPNPFNPETEIRYQLPHEIHVVLEIFDTRGRHVATLVDEFQGAGNQKIRWNGRNSHEEAVGSGMYFCRLKAGSWTLNKKMLLLR